MSNLPFDGLMFFFFFATPVFRLHPINHTGIDVLVARFTGHGGRPLEVHDPDPACCQAPQLSGAA
jgi:hypothetical protein